MYDQEGAAARQVNMTKSSSLRHRLAAAGLLVAAGAGLSGCVVVPDNQGQYRGEAPMPAPAPAPMVIAPPPPQVEAIGQPPGVGYIWIGGYWNWVGNRHVWMPGHWDRGRPGYRWDPHRWERGHNGWERRGGEWRRE